MPVTRSRVPERSAPALRCRGTQLAVQVPVARRAVLGALAVAPLAVARPGSAFATTADGWPALGTGSSGRRHGQWIWQELLTGDPDAAAEFYARAFGWTVTRRGVGSRAYRLARRDGRPVAGLVRIDDRPDGLTPPARWIGLMSVPDVDAAVARATQAGGSVLAGPGVHLGRGRVALLSDPEGAAFGVIRTVDADPEDREPRDGEWLWRELWAGDAGRMAAWYRDLGNYGLRRLVHAGDQDEWVLSSSDTPRAGVIARPEPARFSAWLPYLRVAELGSAIRMITAAGGRVLLEPSPQRRGGRVAIVADPQGGPLGLAQWAHGDVR
jgi:hypothetical protein